MSTTAAPEQRRSRRGLGILAGVAGGLLLMGGTTFALWSANDVQAGGTITNGNLDVAAAGATTYWDVSPDRTDVTAAATPVTALDAHSIADITAYSIVPGDVLEANYGFSVALDGDNLVGDLNLSFAGGAAPPTGVTFTAQAYYLNGATWTAVGTPVVVSPGGATFSLGYFQAANQLNGALDPSIPVITDTVTSATPNVTVVVTATFDAATTGQTSVLATTALGDVTATLNQVRTAGVGNFG